jgi:hypothetical protein
MMLRFLNWSSLAVGLFGVACTGSLTDPGGSSTTGSTPNPGTSTPGGTAAPGSIANAAAGKLNMKGSPAFYRVVRLTNEQWTNSVQSVLGLPTRPTNAEAFQSAVSGTTDFTNNELVLDIDSRGWSDYEAAAEALAAQVTNDAAQLSKIYAGTDAAGFIATLGRRIYRRPLSAAETDSYQKLFALGPSQPGNQSAFAKGASLVLEAMLQSPYFLYRTELGAVNAPLSSYEMAAKLSLWLRNSAPDDALLDAAGGPGKLDTAEGAAAAAQKLLEDPAAKAVMRTFHGEFLHFNKFSQLSKVEVPSYDPAINPELAESAYLFFDKIFSQGLGVRDIFLSTTGFVGTQMAPLYAAGGAAPASGFVERELGPGRVGYFLQLPFLVLYGHNADPDSIHRGVSMSLDVLCAPLGPPAAVIPPLPDPMPGQTNRMRVDAHTSGCGTVCHNNMINPLGFAFENFDGMGQYREQEKNRDQLLTVDSSGSFAFTDGTKSWHDATEFMHVLADDPQTHLCYAKKLASFGLQRDVVEADLPLLGELAATSASSRGSIKQVMLELVKQDAFRVRVGGTP